MIIKINSEAAQELQEFCYLERKKGWANKTIHKY